MPVVIVAIPEAQDRVHKISSEKVPHLTMMYLGDDVPADKLQRIVLFVEHVASQLQRFGLTVDYRGELGDKKADVLFFEKKLYTKELKDTLANLLTNRDIYEAYSSATQFPEWIPHLTLGFPESPAKETEDDFGVHYVSFDRIAVWTGDYDGPEFRLKGWDDMAEAAWSSMHRDAGAAAIDRALAAMEEVSEDDALQFGIKGMKWGVRRSKAELARASADPDAIKAVETQAKIKSAGSLSVVSSKELQQLVDRINLEDKYVKATLASSPTTKKGNSLLKRILKNEVETKLIQGKDGPLVKIVKLAKAKSDQNRAAAQLNRDWSEALRENARRNAARMPAKVSSNPLTTAQTANAGPAARRTRRAQQVYNVTTLGQQGNPLAVPSRKKP